MSESEGEVRDAEVRDAQVRDAQVRDAQVRDVRGRFVKGHPGGPGRPRNQVAIAIGELDRLGIEVAQRLIAVVAEQGLQGNLKAAEMVLQRVWPVRRNRPIEIVDAQTEVHDEPFTIAEHSAVAEAMLEGQIAPQEAQAAARVLKSLQEQMTAAEDSDVTISYTRVNWNKMDENG